MIYAHVFNHAIEDKLLFRKPDDYERFRKGLFYFNDHKSFNFKDNKELVARDWESRCTRTGATLISVLSYTLLPNHFHLLVKTEKLTDLTTFVRKQMTGFTMFFNKKYKRKNRLIASRTKIKIVTSDAHYSHLPNYIHLNVLDLYTKSWRDGLCDWNVFLPSLATYPWSSIQHYVGQKSDPLLDDIWIRQNFPRPEKYLKNLKSWATRNLKK